MEWFINNFYKSFIILKVNYTDRSFFTVTIATILVAGLTFRTESAIRRICSPTAIRLNSEASLLELAFDGVAPLTAVNENQHAEIVDVWDLSTEPIA